MNEDSKNIEQVLKNFTYGVSHDIGAVLRAMTQLSKLLSETENPALSEKEKLWLKLIRENGEKAEKMLGALIFYSQLSDFLHPVETINLAELLKEIIEQKVLEREIDAEFSLTGPEPKILASKQHWSILFEAIIDNCLHYQPLNSSHTPKIIVNFQAINSNDKEKTLIIIEDNGIGMKDSYFERICTPFLRACPSSEYTGMGMGLAYAERAAQLQGASLAFSKSSYDGLKATITIPENLNLSPD